MDWSGKNLCIKCDEGDNLLICSENGCPLAMHERCMGCPARFDDVGRFCCPYCFYKKAVAESRQAREYALERKNALLFFMDENMVGNETRSRENRGAEASGHHQSKVSETNVNSKARNDGHKNEIGDAQNIRNEDGKMDHEKEHETSPASSNEDPSLEHEIRNSKEKKIQEEKCETSSASTSRDTSRTLHERAKREFERSKSKKRNNEAVSVQSKHVKTSDNSEQGSPRKPSRMLSSATTAEKASIEEVDASRRPRQAQQSSVKIPKDTVKTGKRKRLYWRVEEEEKLKEGFHRYSAEVNKINFPWRKVLEFGRDVFDKSRTPTDLGDKWRNMCKKKS